MFVIEFLSSLPVDEYPPDRRMLFEKSAYVVDFDVFYRSIRRTFDLTTFDDVPERDPVSFQEFFLFFGRFGFFFVKNICQHLPETVLRMSVEKARLTAFDRRKTAEYQYFRFALAKGRDRMFFPRISDPFSFILTYAGEFFKR